MKSELKAIQRDAARYRFLRSQIPNPDIGKRLVYVQVSDWAKNLGSKRGPWTSMRITGDLMDKEVDAAMRRKGKRQAKKMTRKDMQAVARNIADVYPGKKLIVLMPGDKIPDELKP